MKRIKNAIVRKGLAQSLIAIRKRRSHNKRNKEVARHLYAIAADAAIMTAAQIELALHDSARVE